MITKFIITVVVLLFGCSMLFAQMPTPALVGYWHNWSDNNAPYIHLDSVDARYNVLEVAFAMPVSNTDMTMQFAPDRGTQQEFITRMQRVQAQGKKVLLSVGGATATIDLTTTANKNAFVSSVTALLTTYGFDGLDIDIESGASILISGGTISAPQNVAQINLIDAIKQIMANYRNAIGRKMLFTLAPETAYVQGGQSGFGSIWGGYLPVLHALRDSIDILQVQLYNSGTMYGIDRNIYTQGTADFIIAMAEAAIRGFSTSGGVFTGLPASKIAIGLPASPSAAGGGFTDSATVYAAMQYLLGKGSKPGNYTLAQNGGYPDVRGMMTWSVNWDAVPRNGNKYQYANGYSHLFAPPTLPLPDKVVLSLPGNTEQLHANSVTCTWQPSSPQVVRYQIDLMVLGNVIRTDSTLTATTTRLDGLPPATEFGWRVRAKNASGWGEWSDIRSFWSVPLPQRVALALPANNTALVQNNVTVVWKKTSPDIQRYNVRVTNNANVTILDSVLSDTLCTIAVAPAQVYTWSVRAQNVSGWSAWSDSWTFSSLAFPAQVQLQLPADNTNDTSQTISFVWNKAQPNITAYRFELYQGATVVFTDSTLHDTTITQQALQRGTAYRWRVQARNESGWGVWSTWRTLRIKTIINTYVDELHSTALLYPNPATSQVYITLAEAQHIPINITDTRGLSHSVPYTLTNSGVTLYVSALPAGVYAVHIQNTTLLFIKVPE